MRGHLCPALSRQGTSHQRANRYALSKQMFVSCSYRGVTFTSSMPDYSGTWNIITNENLEAYMIALGIDFATRKIANALKPQKVIEQNGDIFTIKTITTFKNLTTSFKIGEEFEEVTKGMDNRTCKTTVNWENDKLVCVQKGEKKTRGWTHWIEGDLLYLDLTCEDKTCRQVFKRSAC